jgi:hypothetical protein
MDTTEKKTVEMTPEELADFEAFRQQKSKQQEVENLKKAKNDYKDIVEKTIIQSFAKLFQASETLKKAKQEILADFEAAIQMKTELFGLKRETQHSHTFTNEDSSIRIMVGNYTTDGYRDTVNEGIGIIKEVMASLIKDQQTKALVDQIMKLLSRDQKGNLKPSRVIQLRQMAQEINNDRLLEGVRIIEESYQPQKSKTFIRCDFKDNEEWKNLPLGITEA